MGNGTVRITTDAVFFHIEKEGVIGIGESSLPPYLPETQESVERFINAWMFHVKTLTETAAELHQTLNKVSKIDNAAKAAIDIAWHNWASQKAGLPLYKFLGLERPRVAATYTMGISGIAEMEAKLLEAEPFSNIKLKVGRETKSEDLLWLKSKTNKPLMADANGAFESVESAMQMISSIEAAGFLFLEQPFPKGSFELQAELKRQTTFPIYADEDCQSRGDLEKLNGIYAGVNIKLMKCGGVFPALQMVKKAKELGFKTVLGSMTESSCAINAALSIAPLFDHIDLDGPWLISNNPFEKPLLEKGKLMA